MVKTKSLWDKIWKDKDGRVVIWQNPNIALATWFVAMVLTWFLAPGKLRSTFDLISFGALFIWAGLELFQGANYFRRAVGLIVLIVIIGSRVNH